MYSLDPSNFVDSLPNGSTLCGSGTFGALCNPAAFTACRSWTILHPVEGAAFLTGNRGVLQGESSRSFITPPFSRFSITGFIPSSVTGFRGYYRCLGLYSDLGRIFTGSIPFISPMSDGPGDHSCSWISSSAFSSSSVKFITCHSSI